MRRCIFHRVSKYIIDSCPGIFYFRREIGAQALLKRPDKGSAHAGIVLVRDTVGRVSPSQVAYGWDELIEHVQAINHRANHIHQFFPLFRHVRVLKKSAGRRIQLK